MEYIYGALLLHKLGQPVNESNLTKVVEAVGVHADEAKIKTLIASLQGVDIATELKNASIAVSAPAAGTGETTTEDKVEKKKEEKVSESAAGLASLFG